MPAFSFDPFPRLPTELRLQIWIAACVSYPSDDRGLHYIDVEPSSTGKTLSPSRTLRARLADGDSNSACLRNGGLWTACKESRDIMIYYSGVDYRDCARISIRENGENWSSPVNPTHDIFCIKSKTWKSPDDHGEGWQIQLPYLSPEGSYPTDIKNIAFEFDESWWKVDLPKSYYDLMSETSARGFLSRLLYNRYLNNSATPDIWIIVKNGQWALDPYRPRTKTPFHDYDTDYVLVCPYVSCRRCRKIHGLDGVFQNVRNFNFGLIGLGVGCEKDHPNFRPSYNEDDWGFEEGFNISSGVQFLAHRDMQIDLCTGPALVEKKVLSADFSSQPQASASNNTSNSQLVGHWYDPDLEF